MEEIKFHSLKELYNRIYPALESKRKELHKNNMTYIHEEDIWNCCKDFIWADSRNLGLYQMVNDILNTSNEVFDDYIKKHMANEHRIANEED